MNSIAIINGINLAVQAAPKILEVGTAAVDFAAALFGAGVITREQQEAVNVYVEAVQSAALAGLRPPHWQVE